MENRRAFRRLSCKIPIVAKQGGGFVYGRVVDLGVGGVRVMLEEPIEASQVKLLPHNYVVEDDESSMDFNVSWSQDGTIPLAGLRFSGEVGEFFAGWLAAHLETDDPSEFLDHRRLVRVDCEINSMLARGEESIPAQVVDLSLGGASLVSSVELTEGELLGLRLGMTSGLEDLGVMVLRVDKLSTGYRAGVRFLQLLPAQFEQVKGLVQSLVRGPGD